MCASRIASLASQKRFKKERALMPPGGHVLKQQQRRAIFFVLFLYLGSILISGGKKPCKVGPDRSFSRPAWLVTAPEGLAGPPNVASRPGRSRGRRRGGPGGRDLRPTAHTEACAYDVLERADSLGVFTPHDGPGPVERRGLRPPPRRPRGTRGAGSSRSAPFDSAPTRFAPSFAAFPPLVTQIDGVFGSGTGSGPRIGPMSWAWEPASTAFCAKRAISSAGEWPFQTVIALYSPPFFSLCLDLKIALCGDFLEIITPIGTATAHFIQKFYFCRFVWFVLKVNTQSI